MDDLDKAYQRLKERGVKEGTPDPPNIDIGEMVKGVEEITRKVRDELNVDYVKIESVVGSPSLRESNSTSKI